MIDVNITPTPSQPFKFRTRFKTEEAGLYIFSCGDSELRFFVRTEEEDSFIGQLEEAVLARDEVQATPEDVTAVVDTLRS